MTDTRYDQQLADEICQRISEGTPLRQVCRELDGAPPESTVRQWYRDNRNGFAVKYDAARRLQADSWADEIVLLANRDDIDPHDKRVRIDTLKWLCSKILPKRYGDRLLVAGDETSPIQHLHRHATFDTMTIEQLDALEAFTNRMLVDHAPAAPGIDRCYPASHSRCAH